MNVLQMSRWDPSYHMGGASVRLDAVTQGLLDRGHTVTQLVHHPASVHHCGLTGRGIPRRQKIGPRHDIIRLGHFTPTPLYWLASIPWMAWTAAKIIKQKDIDVILSHNPPHLVGAASILARNTTKTPVAAYLHDLWGASHYGAAYNAFGANLERYTLRNADKLILAGDFDRETKRRSGRTDAVVAPTGVDPDRHTPKINEKGLPADNGHVLFLGQFQDWTGWQHALDIAEASPDMLFEFAGGGLGEDRVRLAAERHAHIIYHGVVDSERALKLVQEAGVCFAPFPDPATVGRVSHAWPISILEYMACGKAIVTSDLPVFENLLRHNVNAVLCPPGDVTEYRSALQFTLYNKQRRKDLGRSARMMALRHTWRDTVDVIEDQLEELNFN